MPRILFRLKSARDINMALMFSKYLISRKYASATDLCCLRGFATNWPHRLRDKASRTLPKKNYRTYRLQRIRISKKNLRIKNSKISF